MGHDNQPQAMARLIGHQWQRGGAWCCRGQLFFEESIMNRHHSFGGTLVLAALALVLAGGAGLDAAGGAKKFQTPQEAFDAFKAAAGKNDLTGIADCLTDDSVDQMAAQITVFAPLIVAFQKEKTPEEKKAAADSLMKTMAKHGMTEPHLKASEAIFKLAFAPKASPEEGKKAVRQLLEPVKDRRAYLRDVVTLLEKVGPPAKDRGSFKSGNFEVAKDSQLRDLKLEGDTARGVVLTTRDGKETRSPITFRREGGSWRVEIPWEGLGVKGSR
jgi:hypothetical protein